MRAALLALPLCVFACGQAEPISLDPQKVETELSLLFDTVPARAIARRAFGEVRLRVVDQKNQLVVSPPIEVTLSLVNHNGAPSFVLGRQTSRDGWIVFDALNVSSTGMIRLSATAENAKAALSDPIVVAPAIARMAFLTQPRDTAIGAVITPAVEVELLDAEGARVIAEEVAIELEWRQHGVLTADPRAQAKTIAGVARFAELIGSTVGDGFSLNAVASGLGNVRSQTFSLTPDAVASLRWIDAPPRSVLRDSGMAFSVELIDRTGQRSPLSEVEVIVEVIEGSVPLRGTTGVLSLDGVATFGDLSYPITEPIRIAVSTLGVEPLISEIIFVYAPPEQPIRAGDELGGEPFAGGQPSLSYDGRVLAFMCGGCLSSSGQMASGPRVIDFDLGTNRALDATPSGAPPDNWDASPYLTRDGTMLAFNSGSTNYVANDVNGFSSDAFVRDVASGAIEAIGLDPQGLQCERGSAVYRGAISDDGNRIAFVADPPVQAPNGVFSGIYVRDRQAGTTHLVADAGWSSFYNTASAALSGDGAFVVFDAPADLSAEDQNRVQDIYVAEVDTGALRRVSKPALTTGQDGASWSPQLTRDGQIVVFTSASERLVAGDTNGVGDVFVADLAHSTLERVSVSGAGREASATVSVAPNYVLAGSDSGVISDDGRFVAFLSAADNLVDGDTNGVSDVFVHDRLSGETLRVNVSVDGVEGDGAAIEVVISGDGRTIAFTTYATNVVPGDLNENIDVYVVGNPLR